ncbi:hypothetical protein H4R35_006297, partial [Dimargaris xerosporica]
ANIYAWSVTMTKDDCTEPTASPTCYQFTVTRDPRWIAATQNSKQGNAKRIEGGISEWMGTASLSPGALDLAEEDHSSTQPDTGRHADKNSNDDLPHPLPSAKVGMAPEQYYLMAGTTLPIAL